MVSSSSSSRPDSPGASSSSSDGALHNTWAAELVLEKRLGSLALEEEQEWPDPLFTSFDLDGVAEYITNQKAKRIIVMVGAGISVAAGIPDFRTPGTGLYDNLQAYGLPHPMAIFEVDFFRKRPEPFYRLAQELYPGNYQPTATHCFLKVLHDKGLLLRCFSQNIDSLETLAGLPVEKLVAAHGNFDKAACIDCNREHDTEQVKAHVDQGKVLQCEECGGYVKPSIIFFGENLPAKFFECWEKDFPQCDLLIVMGTSLSVTPFASLIGYVDKKKCPRLLINRERAGEISEKMYRGGARKGFFWGKNNYRDALYLGDCDTGVRELCEKLGWTDELETIYAQTRDAVAAAVQKPKSEDQDNSDDSSDSSKKNPTRDSSTSSK